MNPGDELAQGIPAGLAQFNPVTKMMGAAQSGGDQIMQLLQALGLMQPQGPMPQTMMPPGAPANPISGTPAPGGLKGRMTK